MNLNTDVPNYITVIVIVLLVIAFGSMFWQTVFVGNPASELAGQAAEVEKQEIISFLENSGLIINFRNEVVADYYEFNRSSDQIFIWGYIAAYSENNNELKQEAGISLPLALNVSEGMITSYSRPRDGEQYEEDIRRIFPEETQEDVLNFHTKHQEDLSNLVKKVEEKARQELFVNKFDKVFSVDNITTLELLENRTTGYQWYYTIKENDIIEVISDEYQPIETEEDIVGAGGIRIITLKGVTPGTTTINFEYYRTEETIDRTKDFSIKIKDKK